MNIWDLFKSGKGFLIKIPDKKATTFIQTINEHINIGSNVRQDSQWFLTNISYLANQQRKTIVKSK